MGLFDFLKKKKKPEPAPKPAARPAPKPAEKPDPFVAKPLNGPALKRRLMEWDVKWSDERLTPYFDEALLSVKESDDPSVLFWGSSSLHELLRIPSDCFRKRIGEVAALEKARDRVVLLHLNSVRYTQPDEKMDAIIRANLKALTGRDMDAEFEDVKRFNAVWVEFSRKVGRYTGSMKRSERKQFEEDIYALCGKMNSCSAMGRLVDVTVQLMQAVDRNQKMGGGVYVATVNLQTGERETSDYPDLQDTERFAFHMIGALPKDVLRQCLDGDDFSTDPASRAGNYDVMLKRGAAIAGLT